MYVAGAQPFGKLEEMEWVEKERSQSLSFCGLATLRLPAGAALQLMEERVPLEIQGIQVYHHLSLECLSSTSPCGGI